VAPAGPPGTARRLLPARRSGSWSGALPYFLATAKHFYTIQLFRERVTGTRALLEPMAYEDIEAGRGLRRRAVIFGDIDRLTGLLAERMARLCDRIRRRRPEASVLNHPTRSMRRYELLRNLHERGINSFNAYRLTEAREPSRYPVFVRRESGHDGAASDPLPDRAALDREIEKLLQLGTPRDDILIVEYLDYRSADGRFRKYGAYLVGTRFIPYQIEISDKWVVKLPAIVTEETIAEELAYVTARGEHEPLLREVFAMANIQYGRIDYTLVDGRPQVFEINTNPVIIGPRSKLRERRPIFEFAVPRIRRAMKALDDAAAPPVRQASGRKVRRKTRGRRATMRPSAGQTI
jgi:hypothetical protein